MFKLTRNGIRLEDWGPIHIISTIEHLLMLPIMLVCNLAVLFFCWGAFQAVMHHRNGNPHAIATLAQLVACGAAAVFIQLKLLPCRGKPTEEFEFLSPEDVPPVARALTRIANHLKINLRDLPVPAVEQGFNARMVIYQEDLLSDIEGRIVLGERLLRETPTEELTCVLAHEIGHHLSYREHKPEFGRIAWTLVQLPIVFPILFKTRGYLGLLARLLKFRKKVSLLRAHAFEYFSDRVAMAVTSPETLIASQQRYEEAFQQAVAMAYQRLIEQTRASAPASEQYIYTRMLKNFREEPGFKEFAQMQKTERKDHSEHPSVEARCQAARLRASRAQSRVM